MVSKLFFSLALFFFSFSIFAKSKIRQAAKSSAIRREIKALMLDHTQDFIGGTLLHQAVLLKRVDFCKHILSVIGQKKLRSKNLEGKTALDLAIDAKNRELADLIFKAYKLPLLNPQYRKTQLHMAAITGSSELVRYLTLDSGESIHIRDSMGLTSIDYAQNFGHQKIAEFLVCKDSYAQNSNGDFFKPIKLREAVVMGRVDLVRFFMKYLTDEQINRVDFRQKTVLQEALDYGQNHIAKILLTRVPEIKSSFINQKKDTKIELAAKAGRADVVEALGLLADSP